MRLWLDPDKIAARGLTAGERRLPIRVRWPEEARADVDAIGALRVPTASGGTTTLASVAAFYDNQPGRQWLYPADLRVQGRLAAAGRFRAGLRAFAETRPVHGECGGYMALGTALVDKTCLENPSGIGC